MPEQNSQRPALPANGGDAGERDTGPTGRTSADDAQPLGWAVVANVLPGVDGKGTKHFSAGTKVWVLPPQWGDGGEMLIVAGRHRGQPGGLTRMVLARRVLDGFRVKPIYSPTVLAVLLAEFPGHRGPSPFGSRRPHLWTSREAAQEGVEWMASTARLDRGETSL